VNAAPESCFVLTAGLGRRLHPLSLVRAKPAVPIAGEPLVRRILRWLGFSRVRRLVLNLHHRPETITRVVGDGSDLGVEVRYSWEQPLLGSAGGPRRALSLLEDDRFFMVNGDTITDVDLSALSAAHARSAALVTLALVRNPSPARFGGVTVADDGSVTGFTAPGSNNTGYHFIGVQIAEARIFESIREGEFASSIGGIYDPLVKHGRIHGHLCDASFLDVGTPRDYLTTCQAIGRAEGRPDSQIGARCVVDPSAMLVATMLWDDVEVGRGAELRSCVVTDGVRIPDRARFDHVMLLPPDLDARLPQYGSRIGDLIAVPFA
jgi:NDP-sugar pyrophosphorylase family protein